MDDFSHFDLNPVWTVTDLSEEITDPILDIIVAGDAPNKIRIVTYSMIWDVDGGTITTGTPNNSSITADFSPSPPVLRMRIM